MWMSMLKPESIGKYSEKRKKTQQPTENQKNTEYRNRRYGARFLYLACQGGGSHPRPPVSYATVCNLKYEVTSIHI